VKLRLLNTLGIEHLKFPKSLLFAIYGISAIHSIAALILFLNRLIAPRLEGDLLMRAQEFTYFVAGLNPAEVSSELGYPIWAYVTASLWFAPLGVEFASLIYTMICLFVIIALFVLLFKSCPNCLNTAQKAVVVAGSMPGFALGEQAKFLNYGLVVAGGLCLFIFCKSLLPRVLGLVLALIKPALCVPAILASSLGKPIDALKVLVSSGAVIALEIWIGFRFLGVSEPRSILKIFDRYIQLSGPKDEFFVSGDYGILNKVVKTGLMKEALAVLLLSAVLCAVVWYLYCHRSKFKINSSFIAVISLGFVPIFTFHRSHDLVLIWPALVFISSFFLSKSSGNDGYVVLVPIFCLFYRGSGGGMLYLYAFIILLYITIYLKEYGSSHAKFNSRNF
jgi:hypothetical protein